MSDDALHACPRLTPRVRRWLKARNMPYHEGICGLCGAVVVYQLTFPGTRLCEECAEQSVEADLRGGRDVVVAVMKRVEP